MDSTVVFLRTITPNKTVVIEVCELAGAVWCVQDVKSRRNPRLVPYALLDERTKKSNRDSLREAIRTLVGYGYDIDPPDQEGETHTHTVQYTQTSTHTVLYTHTHTLHTPYRHTHNVQ